MRWSLEARFHLIAVSVALLSALSAIVFYHWIGLAWASVVLAVLFAVFLSLFITRRFTRPINRLLQALVDGVASFRDGDFSVNLGSDRNDELGDLVRAYNLVGDVLREERQNLFQRELLLDTVIQATPVALVLVDDRHRIVYSNTAARRLFHQGRKLEGHHFDRLLLSGQPDFMRAVEEGGEGLITLPQAGEDEVYFLSHRDFRLNTRRHDLFLFKRLTHELNRQEVATWKKVIRVISHELNNSLAPISSLAHSGATLLTRGETDRLEHIFSTISSRASNLKHFIEGYARFARLPSPRHEQIDTTAFFSDLAQLERFRLEAAIPSGDLWCDPAQLQHVLLNLLKNAREADGDAQAITLSVERTERFDRITVSDRGPGMNESVLRQALLPFYSTKKQGSGLGLPLCREIIEAHGGRLSLSNRSDGGLSVSFTLPRPGRAQATT